MKISKLTPEMIARIPEHVDKWIKIGLSTEPANFEAAESGVLECYKVSGNARPRVILRMSSPYGAAFGAAIAHAMLRAQVDDQVDDQVDAQVRGQVHDQVRGQVYAQVDAQVDDQVYGQVRIKLNARRGGNLWSSWYAYITYLRDICGWNGSSLAKFAHDEKIALNAGWTIWTKDVAAISDRPEKIMLDSEGRLHCENGPAILWRDGYTLYAWHGVRIPPEWTRSIFPSAGDMLRWGNIEQRRAGCSMMGWAKILKETNAKVIDNDADPEIGTLLEPDIPDSGKELFLKVRCATGRDFAIIVTNSKAKTALEAQQWMFPLPPSLGKFIKPQLTA